MVVSEKGYGLVVASDGPVCCCAIPNYGTHLLAEKTELLDWYFIAGKNSAEVISAYKKLTEDS